MKYSHGFDSVLLVFSDPLWLAEDIKTYPSNFTNEEALSEYIRVSVVGNGEGTPCYGSYTDHFSGILLIDIFIPAGVGTRRAYTIADRLDHFLAGKTKSAPGSSGNVQFGPSTLSMHGIDRDDRDLYRAQYSLPFQYTISK